MEPRCVVELRCEVEQECRWDCLKGAPDGGSWNRKVRTGREADDESNLLK